MILLFLIKYEVYLHANANAKGVIPSLSFFAERRGQPLSVFRKENTQHFSGRRVQGDWHSSE